MSQTASEGVVGPSHWRYMATVMTTRLAELLAGSTSADIPEGVLDAAKRFFELVLDAQGAAPQYPSASIANYLIATEALEKSVTPPPKTTDQNVAELKRYADVLDRLRGTLSEQERETLTHLQRFFSKLKESADAEAYEDRVACASSPLGLFR